MTQERALLSAEVCAILGIPMSRLAALRQSKKITCHRRGEYWHYDLREVEAMRLHRINFHLAKLRKLGYPIT